MNFAVDDGSLAVAVLSTLHSSSALMVMKERLLTTAMQSEGMGVQRCRQKCRYGLSRIASG
jgi:hypothetical protein